jgi:hypothetical protein
MDDGAILTANAAALQRGGGFADDKKPRRGGAGQ